MKNKFKFEIGEVLCESIETRLQGIKVEVETEMSITEVKELYALQKQVMAELPDIIEPFLLKLSEAFKRLEQSINVSPESEEEQTWEELLKQATEIELEEDDFAQFKF